VISVEGLSATKTSTLKDLKSMQERHMADCGCGRSPTGQCIGWHNLTEEEYQAKLKELEKNTKEQGED
tara:strand:- start:1413 stop:1616 length:204 start_codon:yes stop_codon:yes gene_type:complete